MYSRRNINFNIHHKTFLFIFHIDTYFRDLFYFFRKFTLGFIYVDFPLSSDLFHRNKNEKPLCFDDFCVTIFSVHRVNSKVGG